MALRRPDVWPAGDLALIVGAQIIWELAERPTAGYVAERAAAWSPWRSVAARLLWSEYLARQRAGTLPRPNQPRRAHRE
jgi:DNA-3-methyladenine glycosylase II